jgi:hypothetical protein
VGFVDEVFEILEVKMDGWMDGWMKGGMLYQLWYHQ